MPQFSDEFSVKDYIKMGAQLFKLQAKQAAERKEQRDRAAPDSIDYRVNDEILNRELPSQSELWSQLDWLVRRYQAGKLSQREKEQLDFTADEWSAIESDVIEVGNILVEAGINVNYRIIDEDKADS